MKILRVRRGFTTNSSGDNEFISPTPPPPRKTSGDASTEAGGANTRSSEGAVKTAVDAHAAAREGRVTEVQVERTDTETTTVAVRQPRENEPPPEMTTGGGALTLIWVAVGVVAMFITERLLRVFFRRNREKAQTRRP